MPTHLTIITGASRGLGLAMAQQRLAEGHRVLAIARSRPARRLQCGADLQSWQFDLAEPAPAAAQLESWLAALDPATQASATLINNAGVVTEPAPLGHADATELSNALRVGLEAPLLLAAAFLRTTAAWTVPRKLLFISSGLGRRAMASSAAYCAAKAGMDHLARAIALEEASRPHGVRVASLAPGVIDTDMQNRLRHADPALFPERERFVSLKTSGSLVSPAAAATMVLRYLDRADFGSHPVADVRDA
ncbi:MAG: SDR family NAD(P)-dependent oxidoreductase [Pseudomonadota bacterium]|nr:SDR family NAD(P)-dependent oxidoreductase [Pseudomonadota bacterium]